MDRTGTKLGRYSILKELASDGMAQVLLARASGMEGFEHHVVVKVLHPSFAHDEQVVSMFLDEARLAARLHHHHVVQVHDVGHEADAYFFAMEYVHGEDLRKLLTRVAKQQQQVPLDQIVTIGMAVAAALHYAHEQRGPDRQPLNIVHRDVSPANIVIGYDGNVKVVDFGIAKAALRSAETQSGTLRGKVAYMAPEQCVGQPIDRRSDVFALGIVLYELCTARRLFKGATDYETMSAIVAGKVPRPSLLRPELPGPLEQIVLKALAASPAERYQTAEELGLDLERAATSCELRVSPTALAAYVTSVFGRRPEPWLVEDTTSIEIVDVDFDGAGHGVVEIDPDFVSVVPFAASVSQVDVPAIDDDSDDFINEPRTEAMDIEEMPTNLADGGDLAAAVEAARLLRGGLAPEVPRITEASPRAAPLAPRRTGNPFDAVGRDEANEPGDENTAIADQESAELFVRLSKIQPTPDPDAELTAPQGPAARRGTDGAPRPTPQPMPVTEAPGAPSQGWAAPPPPMLAAQPITPTGTPMAWAPQVDLDGEVPSLAPAGRRFWVIGGVAAVVLVIGLVVANQSGAGDSEPRSATTTDATNEAVTDAALELDAGVPDAVPRDAAAAKPKPIRPAPSGATGATARGSAVPTLTKPIVRKKRPAKPLIKPRR